MIPTVEWGNLSPMKYDQSQQLLERSKKVIPGGISSNVRALWNPHPLFYDHGQGSHVWDVDGNEYIDYVLGRGPLLLGHTPAPVIEAMKAQLDRGMHYAGQTAIEVDAAEKFCELVPCADLVRFSSTGSEAVHAALRVARAHTGRNKILRFEGHYHGWFDNIAWNFAPKVDGEPRYLPKKQPTTQGQPEEDGANILVLPWNDLELVKKLFDEHGSEIAGVITEPVMCNNGSILPLPGFLEGLRDLCTHHGSVLIFDEVITGFRLSLGGAQEKLGVTPDLATFAKAMGGGTIVSAVAGKADIMDRFGSLTANHSGTYNANPVAAAGVKAALDFISDNGGAELRKAHDIAKVLMEGLSAIATTTSLPLTVRGLPPVFHVSFVPEGGDPIVDYRSLQQTDKEIGAKFWAGLQERGVRTVPEGLWFVSTAHTEEDADKTLSVVREVLREIEA
ncbi:MAG: aspartate aminotransferase family protein [Candidatus Omnitrophica bacterium]|nr:aspartate aminotransferase family protein [Candidatus Omnitrophota bacterium]